MTISHTSNHITGLVPLWSHRNTSMKRLLWANASLPLSVWYGSSFLRELYLEVERLQHGIRSRADCPLPTKLKRRLRDSLGGWVAGVHPSAEGCFNGS